MIDAAGAPLSDRLVKGPPLLLEDALNLFSANCVFMTDYENNATITYCTDVTDELFIIRVKPDNAAAPRFEPGQYAELAIVPEAPDDDGSLIKSATQAKLVRRAYSIASSAEIRDYLEFYIAHVKDGFFSSKLKKLTEGDRIWLGPKIKGKFTLENLAPERDVIMAATGTGIAPFISMLLTFRGKARWRKFVMLHGVRYERDLGYRALLEGIAEQDRDFTYVPMVSREPVDRSWSGLRGRVTDLFTSDERFFEATRVELSPQTSSIFLCGNPEMIDQLDASLTERGFEGHSKKNPAGNIHFERYW